MSLIHSENSSVLVRGLFFSSPSPKQISKKITADTYKITDTFSQYLLLDSCVQGQVWSSDTCPTKVSSLPSRCWRKKASFLTSANIDQSHSSSQWSQGTGYDLTHIWSWGCITHAEHKALNLGSLWIPPESLGSPIMIAGIMGNSSFWLKETPCSNFMYLNY